MGTAKRITVQAGSELSRLLDEADKGPLLLERDGKTYRLVSKAQEDEDFWAGYDPDEVRRVLHEMAGSLPEDEADRMLAELSRRRDEAAGFPTQS